MPEDHESGAEGFFGYGDTPRQIIAGRRGEPLGQRGLKPEHGNKPPGRSTSMWSAGTARSPVRGDVDLEVDMSPDSGPAFLHHRAY